MLTELTQSTLQTLQCLESSMRMFGFGRSYAEYAAAAVRLVKAVQAYDPDFKLSRKTMPEITRALDESK